jgi:hypothetical protein
MTQTPRKGPRQFEKTINRPGRVRLLLDGQLQASRWPGGRWYGSALDWHHDCLFRVKSDRWFPVGAVLVCDHRADVDCFLVNVAQTMAENGLSEEYLRRYEPGGDGGAFQIRLI